MATQTQTELHTTVTDNSAAPKTEEELLDAAAKLHTKPLWKQMAKLNPPLPAPRTTPHIWRYDEIRPSLIRAGELVSEKQAERRVLMLINPSRGMRYAPSMIQGCR